MLNLLGGQFISGPHTETRAARQRGLCFAQIVAARGARGAGPWVRPVFRPQARSPTLSLVATRLRGEKMGADAYASTVV